MIRKALLAASVAAGLSLGIAAPAQATWGHKPVCKRNCGGGTKVPEPGMLGMMGGALIAVAVVRRRKATRA